MTLLTRNLSSGDRGASEQYVRAVVRCYGRAHGWVMHRRVVNQHVQTCLGGDCGLLHEMVAFYERHRRQRRRRRLCVGTLLSMCGMAGVAWAYGG